MPPSRLAKEYPISVRSDDFLHNFAQTKRRLKRIIGKIVNKIGFISVRVTIDAVMYKETESRRQNAGFRSRLTPVRTFVDVDDVVEKKFLNIGQNIENYNENGMSGCILEEILSVRLMVVKQHIPI